MKKWEAIREFLIITFATVIVAAAVFFFLIPSHVSVGSISGLAIVLGNFIPLNISAITLVLNIFLLIDPGISVYRQGIRRKDRLYLASAPCNAGCV